MATINVSILQEAEQRVLHSAWERTCDQASGTSLFYFGTASRHKCLEPGRYLMLMREYHGKRNSSRSGRFPLLGGS
jgi:hypothetical protein